MSSTGLYIHIPFCTKNCPYCVFYRNQRYDLAEAFVQALCKEIRHYKSAFPELHFHSLYFGGGTPNSLSDALTEKLLSTLFTEFTFTDDFEFTMEMNPESVTESSLALLKRYGLNRISLGIQSFDHKELTFLGREHTVSHIENAIALIQSHGFDNYNFDFIINTPTQDKDTLFQTLDTALTYNPTHLSLYSLSIEKGSQFEKQKVSLPFDQIASDTYLSARQFLLDQGFDHYEISAFSLPGYASRHNLTYWRLEGYIGLGPSAVSLYQGRYYKHPNHLEDYLSNPFPKFDSDTDLESKENLMKDYLITRLRLKEGVPIRHFEERFLVDFYGLYGDTVSRLVGAGFLHIKENHLTLSEKGLPVLDSVLEEFL